MPVTIGTLTSNVNVEDTRRKFSEEDIEYFIQKALVRWREERYLEEQARQEQEIPDRMSETDPY